MDFVSCPHFEHFSKIPDPIRVLVIRERRLFDLALDAHGLGLQNLPYELSS
jgi:hypothetical protein